MPNSMDDAKNVCEEKKSQENNTNAEYQFTHQK